MNAKEEAIDTLARTLWGEARGEGAEGIRAVACVIMNRVHADLGNDGKSDWWGEGVVGVCRKPYQFSCWNRHDPNLEKLLTVGRNDEIFRVCQAVATLAVNGGLHDITGGATHYHTKEVKTSWSKGKTPTAIIGNHLFYKL